MLSRRSFLGAAALAALGIGGGTRQGAAWANEALLNVELPPDNGQTGLHVYVPETRHTVRGTFLDYWRANGTAAVFGNPISEPFAAPNGYYSQAFERGILQYRPEFLWSEEPIVRLMPIHDIMHQDRPDRLRRDGRRAAGGGYPRSAAWRPLDAASDRVRGIVERGGVFFPETGHTLRGDALAWYEEHEGGFYLGPPVSEPMTDRGRTVQFFTGGVLESDDDEVRLGAVGRSTATALAIDLTPVDRAGLPDYDEALFITSANPNPIGSARTPGRRWIEISLREQTLWAYQGSTMISSTLVSTGIPPNNTSKGTFHLRLKYPLQDMEGYTDGSGAVVGFGEAPPGMTPYQVEDVPNVMYFSLLAEALHGAYWHNNFGTPMSHGCVNLPLDFAAWLYGWAPLGTMVRVRD